MISASKATGWFLILFGLGIIVWTLYCSYNIFTAKALVPEIFEMKAEVPITTELPKTPEAQIQAMLGEKIQEMLPLNLVPRLLNLTCWSIFAGIMFFGGSQIASIGIKLTKQ